MQAVEEAAIKSLRHRAHGEAASAILRAIPDLPKPRQWAFTHALIDMIAPHLRGHRGDPLDIRSAVGSLPVEFGVEANRSLDRRHQEVDRKERDLARKEE